MTVARTYHIALLFVTILCALPGDGFSCSLVDGYLKPSNYELVRQTGAIVLAEAVRIDRTPLPNTRFSQPKFTFRIIQVLKGSYTATTLLVSGVEGYLGGGSENDFLTVRKGAGTGACNAYDYEVGKQFLLFLNQGRAGWEVSGPPFSRINEEVSGGKSPWMTAVLHYVRIGELKDYDQEKIALRDLQKAARADGTRYPSGLDRDIDSFFERPSPIWSYQDLLDLYMKGTAGQRRQVSFPL